MLFQMLQSCKKHANRQNRILVHVENSSSERNLQLGENFAVRSFTGMGRITGMDYRNGHLYVDLGIFLCTLLGQSGLELPQKVISPRKM